MASTYSNYCPFYEIFRLVGGVAHELNTPIGNALVTASMLADTSKALKEAMSQNEIRKSTLQASGGTLEASSKPGLWQPIYA